MIVMVNVGKNCNRNETVCLVLIEGPMTTYQQLGKSVCGKLSKSTKVSANIGHNGKTKDLIFDLVIPYMNSNKYKCVYWRFDELLFLSIWYGWFT